MPCSMNSVSGESCQWYPHTHTHIHAHFMMTRHMHMRTSMSIMLVLMWKLCQWYVHTHVHSDSDAHTHMHVHTRFMIMSIHLYNCAQDLRIIYIHICVYIRTCTYTCCLFQWSVLIVVAFFLVSLVFEFSVGRIVVLIRARSRTYESDSMEWISMSHTWTSHGTHLNESWNTHMN